MAASMPPALGTCGTLTTPSPSRRTQKERMSPQELFDLAVANLATAVSTPVGVFALCSGAVAVALAIVSSFVRR